MLQCLIFFSDESKQAFANWKDYDDSLDMFCEVDGKPQTRATLLCRDMVIIMKVMWIGVVVGWQDDFKVANSLGALKSHIYCKQRQTASVSYR